MATESGAAKGRTAAEAETLEAQIETLKGDIAQISTTLQDLVKAGVREGRVKAERTAEHYKQQGKDQADAAMDSAREYSEALEMKIEKNPFSAVLVALGLGFLIGLMSRR